MLNRKMCLGMLLLANSLLFTFPTPNTKTPLLANECKEDIKIDLSNVDTLEKDIERKIKAKEEIERRVQARLQAIEEDKEKVQYINFELTFYTFLECKDKWNAVTCHGDRPYQGIVASNVYPQGTIIHLEEWGEVLVWDRGGSNFNSPNRLDVFLDPLPNESEAQYKARAFKMGHVFTKGYIKEE